MINEELKKIGVGYTMEDIQRMSPEDKKRFHKALILKAIKNNPTGVTIHQIAEVTGIDRRTVSNHLQYLIATREIYKRQLGVRTSIYYPNHTAVRPTLDKDIKIDNKYYSFQFIENPFGKFVAIQEKTKDEYNLFTTIGGLMINIDSIGELIHYLDDFRKEAVHEN